MKDRTKLYSLLVFLMATIQSKAQNDFLFGAVANIFKGTNLIEENKVEVAQESFKSGHADVSFASTIESKFFFVLDGSAFTFFNNGTYNFGVLDTRAGLSFHPNHPIRFGDNFQMVFGGGGALGFKIANLESAGGSFLAYGIALDCIINIGDNFQMLYVNTATPGFNPRYEEMARTKHEFFIMYNINDKGMLGISPYIETFRYVEANKLDIDITSRVKGLRIGYTGTLKW